MFQIFKYFFYTIIKMIAAKAGTDATQTKIERTERQFQGSQEDYGHQTHGMPYAIMRDAGQQHGLLKLGSKKFAGLPNLPDEVIQEIKLGVIEQQLGRRYGRAAGVPTQNIDPSIGRGLAVAEEKHGLRTLSGAVLEKTPRPVPKPKYPTPKSPITPRKPKQPSLKKLKKLKKASDWGSKIDAMDAAATDFAKTGKRFKFTKKRPLSRGGSRSRKLKARRMRRKSKRTRRESKRTRHKIKRKSNRLRNQILKENQGEQENNYLLKEY